MSTPTDYLIQSIRSHRLAQINTTNNNNVNVKHPCGICNFEVKHNDKAILCTTCNLWIHIKCNGISTDDYENRQLRNNEDIDLVENETWLCLNCTLNERSDFIPFILLSSHELSNMNSLDSMKLLELLPETELTSEALETNSLVTNDIDESMVENISCKYYTCDEFYNIDNKKTFNIFHSNVNGYVSHIDNLQEFFVHSNTDFDVICISETSLQNEATIPQNAKLSNYNNPFTTNTLTSKGGVAIFTKNNHEAFERDDLKVCTPEFEAVWIEIKIKGSKSIVIGCTYRHPHYYNIEDFSNYINKSLIKLNKENKEVYVTGDFNIDLLKYETNTKYREFYNLMTSNGFLPLIIQPTRITETTKSLIDNIYTNEYMNDNESGNILLEIADHLIQFVSVQKHTTKLTKDTYYKRNHTNWNEEHFIDDLSIQNWEFNSEDPDLRYNDLIMRYESCVNRHLPLKKMNKKEIKMKSKPWITSTI